MSKMFLRTDEGWKSFDCRAEGFREELGNRKIVISDNATVGDNVTVGYNAKVGSEEEE